MVCICTPASEMRSLFQLKLYIKSASLVSLRFYLIFGYFDTFKSTSSCDLYTPVPKSLDCSAGKRPGRPDRMPRQLRHLRSKLRKKRLRPTLPPTLPNSTAHHSQWVLLHRSPLSRQLAQPHGANTPSSQLLHREARAKLRKKLKQPLHLHLPPHPSLRPKLVPRLLAHLQLPLKVQHTTQRSKHPA